MLISLGVLIGWGGWLYVGRGIAERHLNRAQAPAGIREAESAAATLLALLLAFTVAGAAERFDARRRLIVDEANAIGTAYLRLDLLPPDRQPALRRQFGAYLDSRITAFRLV